MESNNPALRNAPQFKRGGYAGFDDRSTATAPSPSLEDLYAAPAASPAQTGRMTYDDVVMRTAMVLGLVLVGAVFGWMNPGLAIIGAIVGLVLGLVNAFKREPSPALILAYGAFQGVFLGGISWLIDSRIDGPSVAVQAALATFATFGVMLALYRSGAIRATPRFRKIMLGAVLGYAVFCLVNFVFMMFGAGGGFRTGALGLLVGAVGAVLAALSLVLDFDFIEQGVRNGIPQRYAWTAAFGLAVTLIWLYIEFLRIIAILRGSE